MDDNSSPLERQRAEIEATFRIGLVPQAAGTHRLLNARLHRLAKSVINDGALLPIDPAVIRAVRDGAQPGHILPAPAPMPFILGVREDFEVGIVKQDDEKECVAILFSHEKWPGHRFGYRFATPDSAIARYGPVLMKEQIETGAIDRMMRGAASHADERNRLWVVDSPITNNRS